MWPFRKWITLRRGMSKQQWQAIADASCAMSMNCKSAPRSNNGDYDWDWDFQTSNGQFVCRGIQTGRYTALEKCQCYLMDDARWPR